MAADAHLIDTVLQEWAGFVVEVLHESLQRRKLILTEDLYKSLRYEILHATAEGVVSANFFFREHGRWQDMRTIRNKKRPPISVIEDFVRQRGTSGFKYVPGYPVGKMPAESIALRRIAWGVASGILKRNQTVARKWYAKKFYRTLERLINGLMDRYQETAGNAITNGMQ